MEILLLTDRDEFAQSLSGLRAFGHSTTRGPLAVNTRANCELAEAVLVDGSSEEAAARESCRKLGAWAPSAAVLAVVATEDFSAVGLDWHVDDVVVATASPAEVNARLQLARARRHEFDPNTLQFGPLVIRPDSFTASLSNRELGLTLTEFKLLHHLVRHAGQACSRTRLLQDLWSGKGNRRKVDVHVQRLRAKLGSEYESMVDTVRGVGYMAPQPPQTPWAVAN